MEIIKQINWSETALEPFHFGGDNGAEVDLVREDRKKNLYGMVIKSKVSVSEGDFKGLNI